jgi:hypothetical protein
MADLRTDYQDDVLDASENTARVYDLVDSNGNVVLAGVHLEDKTVYTTEGDDYGAADINEQNEKINGLNADLSKKIPKSNNFGTAQTLTSTANTNVTVEEDGLISFICNCSYSYGMVQCYINNIPRAVFQNREQTQETATFYYTAYVFKDDIVKFAPAKNGDTCTIKFYPYS